jgi:rubredoxin
MSVGIPFDDPPVEVNCPKCGSRHTKPLIPGSDYQWMAPRSWRCRNCGRTWVPDVDLAEQTNPFALERLKLREVGSS